tara:strand:+ start:1158 stop:1721 length:564 start_codon:yes stop_codon:yes gene_type:complete
MASYLKENVVLILFIIHLAVSIFFFFLRWSQDKKVTEEKDLGEEEQITKKNIQTQLFIHSGISVAVCVIAILYCFFYIKEIPFILYQHGPMILHLVASGAVLGLNFIPDSSLWLSWIFQIVSILVTGAQCIVRLPVFNKFMKVKNMTENPIATVTDIAKIPAATPENPPLGTQFGKKLLNFGKRKLK